MWKYVKLVIPFLISVLILVVGYFSWKHVYKRKAVVVNQGFFPDESRIRALIDPECKVNETIEYYYYKTPEKSAENNKFGLYVYAEDPYFLELVQNLVNSKGGDWGYVHIPYNVKDYDRSKWEAVFARLHNKHLIPIIQLWDVNTVDYEKQTEEAALFLDSFLWPIRQRYISVYNEPNDAKFWYDRVDPKEYAQILDFTIDTFKDQNENFFMLNGALNVSAHTSSTYLDAFDYMYAMNQEVPGIFSKLDGWASHSYPQPNFSGSPYATGRNSIRAYEQELAYLKTLGVEKDLPVFITETGWAHAEGKNYDPSYLTSEQIAKNLKIAYEDVWLPDDRVQAVTPFTIWYEAPFDHFSWINKDKVPYYHYDAVKSLRKVSGDPEYLVKESTSIIDCN